MIGKLTGRLDSVSLSAVIVDVGGVGYEVTVGARTLTSLPPIGEVLTLAIDTHVREDEIRLYGFATEHERAWFRALQTVQGVGARIALAVLGTHQSRLCPWRGCGGRLCRHRQGWARGAGRGVDPPRP
jgi:holliday junction DNA helicase RuvA